MSIVKALLLIVAMLVLSDVTGLNPINFKEKVDRVEIIK